MDEYDEILASNRGDEPEPDQIDMMDSDELRTEFRASQAREAALREKLAEWKSAALEREALCVKAEAELRKLLEEGKVPEGWQLVPNEPTEEMLQWGWYRKRIYQAMLAAAPQPPKEPTP